MKRDILQHLIKWKHSEDKKPLIIKGARQVGKTYIIREFAKTQYRAYIEINFERDLQHKKIFASTHDPNEILEYFKLTFLDVSFDQDTLFFMDEIQSCPDALTALKFLSESFPCDIICSGSMLGIAIARSSSYPVRYVDTWELYPMSFKEFLDAYGIPDSLCETLRQHIHDKTPIPDYIHDKFNQLFFAYMACGGMPEVVKAYVKERSFYECLKIQRSILQDYLADMIKYAEANEALKIRECFSSIPLQLAKENKKFQYSVVKKGYNARYYDASLRWLEDSGLILKVNRLAHIATPLVANKELSVFKVYMADVGLFLSSLEDGDIQSFLLNQMGTYKGVLYENVIAQTLRRMHKTMYYYEPSQNTEIDFIIEYQGHMTPLEVKANKHTTSISFKNFVKKYDPTYAFRLSQKNIGKDETYNIFYLPHYALEFLLEEEAQYQKSEMFTL